MELIREVVTFNYGKNTRRPRRLENNVFVIYCPETIKISPGESKLVNMQIKILFSKNIEASCRINFTLANMGLKLINSNTISQEINANNSINIVEYVDSNYLPPWNLQFELFNSSFVDTFKLIRRQKLGYFFVTNDRGKEINYRFKKKKKKKYLHVIYYY